MNILSVETSCDETAVSILRCEGEIGNASFEVLGDALFSQIDIHKEYGGVFPALAKRAHAQNLVPLLRAALSEAELFEANNIPIDDTLKEKIDELLTREPELSSALIDFADELSVPHIDAIAVTHGPGLEPALWVGVNFAKALSLLWNIPVIPVNHMEGHTFASLIQNDSIKDIRFPILSLLISGGHTELILMKDWFDYELIGMTLDDAIGEAYDKVARMMGLPYPGGREIDALATRGRSKGDSPFNYPRPMLGSGDCNFSFSGLKTAVLYSLKDKELTEEDKENVAQEVSDAIADVIVSKTKRALEEHAPVALLVGGGVSANSFLRDNLQQLLENSFPGTVFYTPKDGLYGDNAVMIGYAGYFRYLRANGTYPNPEDIKANGTLRIEA